MGDLGMSRPGIPVFFPYFYLDQSILLLIGVVLGIGGNEAIHVLQALSTKVIHDAGGVARKQVGHIM